MSLNITANESILNDASIMNCSICLNMITDEQRCIAKDCMHQYCVGCLKEWLKINGKCPLCKLRISSIIYNINDDRDYKEEDINQGNYDSDSDASTIEFNGLDSNSSYSESEFNEFNVEINFGLTNFNIMNGGLFSLNSSNAITIDSDSDDESENDTELGNANESGNSNESGNESSYYSPNSSNVSMSPVSVSSNSSANSTSSDTTNTSNNSTNTASVSSFDIDSDDSSL